MLTAITQALGEFIGWGLIAVAGALVYIFRQTSANERAIAELKEETKIEADPTRLEDHERRMGEQQKAIAELKQYFVGDPDDPSQPGLLSEIHDIKERLEDNGK